MGSATSTSAATFFPDGCGKTSAAYATAPSRDPFFDRPYEPSPSSAGAAPTWEVAPKAAATVPTRGLSPNIRPKKKVASLLGGGA